MKQIEVNVNGIKKNQIIQKIKTTEEKKMKIRGIICPKKIKNTQEVLEMTRSGLINLLNLPIVHHREGINVKNYRRNLMKMFEVNHQVTMRKNVTNNVLKLNTTGKEIFPKRSEMSSITKIPGTDLSDKPDDEVIEVDFKTAKWKSRG